MLGAPGGYGPVEATAPPGHAVVGIAVATSSNSLLAARPFTISVGLTTATALTTAVTPSGVRPSRRPKASAVGLGACVAVARTLTRHGPLEAPTAPAVRTVPSMEALGLADGAPPTLIAAVYGTTTMGSDAT